MDIELTVEQRAFRDEVRIFFRDRLPNDIRESMSLGFTATSDQIKRWQKILNERGWAAPHWPAEYGGSSLGEIERLILLEEAYSAPAPLPLGFNVNMLGPVLLKFGTQKQKDHFLPKLANLDLWFCQGFSEPGAGSDLASLRTSARKQGDHYCVSGQKIWTSSAHIADWVFCLVRTTTEARKQDGISFLMIDMRSPGVTVRPIISIDNEHHLNEVFFDDVLVPVENLVGEEGQGWACAKYLLSNERIGVAHVGLCRERLQYAVQLLLVPEVGTSAYRREIALLSAELRSLEVTQWRLLTTPSTSSKGAVASMLKLKGVELQQSITGLLQRMAGPLSLERRGRHGDQSRHWASALTMRYLFLRAASIYGGSNEVQKDIVAKLILDGV